MTRNTTSPTAFAGVLAAWCRERGLAEPVREHKFHERRKWMFDFAWKSYMTALEIEGGTWTQGRHSRGRGYEDDCEKYNEATLLGWRVLRVTTGMVTRGEVWGLLERGLLCTAENVRGK